MIAPNTAIPWHLICELFASGKSTEELATRFNIPQKIIQRRLDVALSASGYVRTNQEIKTCSHKVKTDLITTLQRFSHELASKSSELDDKDLLRLERLTNIATKLFAWPSAKAVDITSRDASPNQSAINLDLIKRDPDSLSPIHALTLNADTRSPLNHAAGDVANITESESLVDNS